MQWKGVMPAMTTAFDEQLNVDQGFVARHARWLIENGCTGIICLGSLGEAATLTFDEKIAIVKTVVDAVSPATPVVAAISALATTEAVKMAEAAAKVGAQGLMILPPYVYKGDWREMRAHVAAILTATPLEGMLYNNPVAYGTDFTPEQIADLADEFPNLVAVKESSTDVRRVTAIRALTGDRLAIFMGVDDAIVEGVEAGAVGWVAGVVNALPRESVEVFDLAASGDKQAAFALYRWLLPLLRMDTVPKFVQLIKQVQEELGAGNARVRPPRLQVVDAELAETRAAVAYALANRVAGANVSTPFQR
ncbi:dihydrodipicolinate synthase family protein [Terracidiphilus sp.]|jgi:4-hydroxy-tetrahydrodipicolinate synthase|uniref:dihydrodipicolinate synthase family protein n=1 Tax=Terracidiphilus sp. TaxID=1964191 RepID=UPI003C148585